MRPCSSSLVVIVCLLSCGDALAAPATPGRSVSDRELVATAGWESTWVLGLRGGWRLGEDPLSHSPLLEAGLVIPVVVGPHRGGRFLLAASSLLTHDILGVRGVGELHLTWAHDSTGSKVGPGLALELHPGVYGDRWAVVAIAGWRSSMFTCMWHSDEVHDLFGDRYPDGVGGDGRTGARNGCYGFPAHRVRMGLAAAVRARNRGQVGLAGGLEWHPARRGIATDPPVHPLPFFLLLSGGLTW